MKKTCKHCNWLENGICQCRHTKFQGMRVSNEASCVSWLPKINKNPFGDKTIRKMWKSKAHI